MINPITAITAFFKVKSEATELIKEATTMNGTKPGYLTTEFWGKVALQVLSIWGACKGLLPANYALIGTIVLEAGYNVGRAVVKAVADVKTAKAGQAVPVTVDGAQTVVVNK